MHYELPGKYFETNYKLIIPFRGTSMGSSLLIIYCDCKGITEVSPLSTDYPPIFNRAKEQLPRIAGHTTEIFFYLEVNIA